MDAFSPALCAWLTNLGLRVEDTTDRGRCLLAARAFSAGELVLSAPVFAAAAAGDVCDSCGARADMLRRCSGCKAVSFCNAACQAAAWKHHHAQECPALSLLHSQRGRAPPPSLRLAHRALLRRAESTASDAPAAAGPALLAALRRHQAAVGDATLLECAQAAAALASYALQPGSEPWRAACRPKEAAGLLLALRSNAHTVSDEELQPRGVALLPLVAACVNHSCAPTAGLSFPAGFAAGVLRSLRPLPAGTEVTHAYADIAGPAFERRAVLRSGYFFHCACTRCAAAFARGGSDDDRALGGPSCSQCAAALPFDEPLSPCLACGDPPCAAALAQKAAIDACAARTAAAAAARQRGDAAAAAREAAAAVAVAESCRALPRTAACRTRALEEVSQAAVMAQEWSTALRAAEAALPGALAAHQGGCSHALGLHWALLGRLRWACEDPAGAGAAYERAVSELGCVLGRGAPLVGRLAQSGREAAAAAAHAAAAGALE